MRVIRILGGTLVTALCLFIGFLLYLMVTDFQPEPVEVIPIWGTGNSLSPSKTEFSFLSWNVGYCGLGSGMDFFYEGGKRVRPEINEFKNYLGGVIHTLSGMDSVDFIFLQEADLHSKRSYFTNEVEEVSKCLPGYCSLFAKNYDTRFVPVPLTDPMGRVISGIASFNRFKPQKAERIDFGTRFPWPKQLVFLKRCFMVMRFKLGDGKDLVVINTHNSTFDKGGMLRKPELQKLHTFMMTEYARGNYVICGGDWNNNPRGFDPGYIHSGDRVKTVDPPLDTTFIPGWRFLFDPTMPTNRDVDMPYRKSETQTTIIDFFVVSPNIDVRMVKTISNRFAFSDHQPVYVKVHLNQKGI
jgi:endonuclease/exonuclease/phosphatase family metal-dependent hydrolase